MNISPPPENATLIDLREWCNDLYRELQYPTFETIRFIPRSSAPDAIAGNTYYDSDDNKLKVRDNTSWQDTF